MLARLLTTVLILLGAMLLLFALSAIVPGDPAKTLLGPQASPEYAQRFIAQMGLDQPLPVRLFRFFSHLLRGDLGIDVITGRNVGELVLAALPTTLILTFGSIGLSVLVGVPLGCLAAVRPGSLFDTLLAVLGTAFVAIPGFVVALGLLLLFAIRLHWLPVLGSGTDGGGVAGYVLPVLALALGWVGYVARLMRASMLDALAAPHIRTAVAYGLPRATIVGRYALRNAAAPVLAVLGLGVGRLLGGAVLVEIVFARPGLGKLVLDAISTRNYPVVQGAVFVVVLLFVAANLTAELLQAWIDPRVRRG